MLKRLVLCVALTGLGTVSAGTPTILVVGDSLSSGHGVPTSKSWVSLLKSRLREQGFPHEVINSSVSGDTTTNGVTRIR
ncbi:MAG: arylesterase, partial [Gammaproteobacteria bacterium]|nr:arylesterase [Gammaproteobacteria bacterium]